MLVQQLQIALQLAHGHPQTVILALQMLVFPHHPTQLLLQLLKPSYPLLVDDRTVYVNRHLHLKRHLHLYFFLNFHVPVDVDRLVHVHRLIDYDWILVDRLIDVYGFFYYFLHLDLLHYYLRNLLFYFNVLGHLYDLLDYSFRAGDVPRHLYLDLHWPFYNQLLDGFFRRCLIGLLCSFLEHLVLDLQSVLLCL